MSELVQSLSNPKIQRHHVDRMAIVYVRQSTPQQLTRHPESTRLQYSLVDRAVQLGWLRSQVLLIDDDLGKSGSSIEGRVGFQRLVSEVSLNRVGLVLGIEMSRLARCCRDWYQLLEVCGLFGTLIGDCDGIYDPGNFNDRLLLGLKGNMSEAELHLIKQRMLAGKRAKAARGELGMQVPRGYIRAPTGEVVKDPDEQVQATIALIFAQFAQRASVNGLLQYLVRQHILLPDRVRHGMRKGDLEWRRPNRATLLNLLHNPIYAGAYVYGRRPTDARLRKPGHPGSGKRVATQAEWAVLRKDTLPSYIDWEQFQQNQLQMQNNQVQAIGPIRHGPSLLPGLLFCGRCGRRMATTYRNNGHQIRYECSQMAVDYGGARCQSLVGQGLDDWITQQVLQALEPAALEISLQAAEQVQAERAQLHQHWQQRLERAGYQVQRTARQYHAVEPENRMVARTLERQWEEALQGEARLKEEYEDFVVAQPVMLTPEQREAIRRLATDIPALWNAASTTAADRQNIVRQLIERVVVNVQHDNSERVDVQIHWRGGQATGAFITRPVARLDQLSYYPQLAARVTALHQQGCTGSVIAQRLNAEGWRPAKRRTTFNGAMVNELMTRLGLRTRQHTPATSVDRQQDEWTFAELAHLLDMPLPTLYTWMRRGQCKARLVTSQSHRLWLVHANQEELATLRLRRDGKFTPGAFMPSEKSPVTTRQF